MDIEIKIIIIIIIIRLIRNKVILILWINYGYYMLLFKRKIEVWIKISKKEINRKKY